MPDLRAYERLARHLMSRDPRVLRLPDPARLDGTTRTQMVRMTLAAHGGSDAEIDAVIAALTCGRPTLAIADELREISPAFVAMARQIGSTEYSTGAAHDGMLLPVRYHARHGRILTFDGQLNVALAHTDIDPAVPCGCLRLPYPAIYLEFDPGRAPLEGLTVWNPQSGEHVLEGGYLIEFSLAADDPRNAFAREGTGLPPGDGSLRIIECAFHGAPKAHLTDDAYCSFTLVIADEDEPALAAVDRTFARSRESSAPAARERIALMQAEAHRLISHASKALLYLGCRDVRLEPVNERSDLEARLARLGPKKGAKLARRARHVYDRVRVHHELPLASGDGNAAGGARRNVATHWRRGHFRYVPCGPGRRERRHTWIAPTLVHGHGQAHVRHYAVR